MGDGRLGVPVTPLPEWSEMSDKGASVAKFVQIASAVHGGEILLYALDESGDVWRFDDKTRQWVMLPRGRR
ncbi:MAG TPA: hypothetical protein VFC42_16665 [Methylomirabilota bacterium]|nr:hypothetical protein [Methylomirabilota bacterium]